MAYLIGTYLIGVVVITLLIHFNNPRFTPWMLLTVVLWPIAVLAVVWAAATMVEIQEKTEERF